MRIVFMGTPVFAVPALHQLIKAGHDIVTVVTPPDRGRGRGQKLQPVPVKMAALEAGIPVLQPENLKDSAFRKELYNLKADCFIVVAFQILPPVIFEMPSLGTINLHASLLPKYRGAAPIQWALINGDSDTGVTTFFIERRVDTGAILLQEKICINPEDNAGSLHDRLSKTGAELLVKTAALIETKEISSIPQEGKITRAPKIEKHHCLINWSKPAIDIFNLIRGLTPFPGAAAAWKGKRIKISRTKIRVTPVDIVREIGEIVEIGSDTITVQTGQGFLDIYELQLQGKKKMSTADFLRGNKMAIGDDLRLKN